MTWDERFEHALVRHMHRVLLVLGVAVFLIVCYTLPRVPTVGPMLNALMICIVPVAFGLPLFAIRVRHREMTYDPYEIPFGEVVNLPRDFVKRG